MQLELERSVKKAKSMVSGKTGIKNSDNHPKKLKNHKLSLTCVCIDSKDRHAYTGSKDGSIIKWCLKTGKIVGKISSMPKKIHEALDPELRQRHLTGYINCLAISSDDKFLASGGGDKLIRIWSPETLEWMHTFKLHKMEVTALVFRQGFPSLYSGSADRSVNLWTLEDDDNRCYIESLYGHESPITSIDCLKREKVLTTGGLDQTIRIWKIVDQAQAVYEAKHESVDIAKYIDENTFVSGGEDGVISIWTTMKKAPLYSLPDAHKHKEGADKDMDEGCRFDQKSTTCWISALATFSFKAPKQAKKATKKQKLNNYESGKFVTSYETDERQDEQSSEEEEVAEQQGGDTDSVAQTKILALIASGSCNSEINLWKLVKIGGKYELQLHQALECPGFINDLRFTSNGTKLVAACGQEHKFGRWWKLKKAKNCIRVFDVKEFE